MHERAQALQGALRRSVLAAVGADRQADSASSELESFREILAHVRSLSPWRPGVRHTVPR